MKSINLFKKCGYELMGYNESFGEYEYRKNIKGELTLSEFLLRYNVKEVNAY
jgi:hypothetical protein